MTVVARATAPSGRRKTKVETHPVGKYGSDLRKALNAVPVLLTADGIVPFMMSESREGVNAKRCTLVGWATLLPACAVLVNVERQQGKCDTTRGMLLD